MGIGQRAPVLRVQRLDQGVGAVGVGYGAYRCIGTIHASDTEFAQHIIAVVRVVDYFVIRKVWAFHAGRLPLSVSVRHGLGVRDIRLATPRLTKGTHLGVR
ncbi:hypothetical protein WJ16_17360 [Burkholderia metallica]|nr:hypothetical protein WJ16_17360 [Burkholderia metallica]